MPTDSQPQVNRLSDATIIQEFVDYQIRFVEQKSDWNSHSVCPFAKLGRQSGRIRYEVLEFSREACRDESGRFRQMVRAFAAQSHELVLLLIHPDRQAMSYSELEELIDVELTPMLSSLGLEAFSGHPEHPLNIRGVHLRREPFVTLQLIRQRVSHRATQGLYQRNYFEGWSDEALQYAAAHSAGYQTT